MTLDKGDGARGRIAATPAEQTHSGFHPYALTSDNPPSPVALFSNLGDAVPLLGVELKGRNTPRPQSGKRVLIGGTR